MGRIAPRIGRRAVRTDGKNDVQELQGRKKIQSKSCRSGARGFTARLSETIYSWRISPHSGARKEDGEAAALSFARLGSDATSVGLRDTLDDRQAQAGAAPIPLRLSVSAEYAGHCVGCIAYGWLLDRQLELRPGVCEPHAYSPAAWH